MRFISSYPVGFVPAHDASPNRPTIAGLPDSLQLRPLPRKRLNPSIFRRAKHRPRLRPSQRRRHFLAQLCYWYPAFPIHKRRQHDQTASLCFSPFSSEYSVIRHLGTVLQRPRLSRRLCRDRQQIGRVGQQLFEQDRGNFGNETITLDWAYGDYRYQDWLGVRVGKVKIPLGLYNESRDNDALRNPILLPQGLYSDYFRDVTNSILGAGIYGTAPHTPMGKFAYQFYVGTLPLNNDSALAGALQASSMSSGPTYSYGLEWQPPVDGLRLAVTGLSTEWSTTFGTPAAPTNLSIEPFQRQFFSVEYVRDNLTLNAEYGLEDLDFDWSFASSVEKRQGDSWYVGSAYRFTDWMELGAYYNEYYVDRNHRDGSSHASFNNFPNDFNMYQKDLG